MERLKEAEMKWKTPTELGLTQAQCDCLVEEKKLAVYVAQSNRYYPKGTRLYRYGSPYDLNRPRRN
jgi:hypothetical protein